MKISNMQVQFYQRTVHQLHQLLSEKLFSETELM